MDFFRTVFSFFLRSKKTLESALASASARQQKWSADSIAKIV